MPGPDTLTPYKQENRNCGKFLSVDLFIIRNIKEKYIIIITIICDHDAISAKNACPDGYA